ncbi:MAG: citrate/2-methylcitrate synthase [Hyphomicrobiaceae bacterium]
MATRDMASWETAIAKVVSEGDTEEIVVRGHRMSDLVGQVSFSEMMFLMLQGRRPSAPEARTLDALLVASIEHGIAPPSMIARCYASYGTTIQAAVGAGITAFGDRMGGLGEQLAQLLTSRLGPLLAAGAPDDARLRELADAIVGEAAAARTRVPGYGIPLHAMDPRALKVLEVARREGTFGPYCRLGLEIEAALKRVRGGRAVPMNLDGVSAVVALDLGFDWRLTRLFLLTPRTVSFAAHFIEEQDQDTTWRHLPADVIRYVGKEPGGDDGAG